MLPQLPEISSLSQFPILQAWLGLASILAVFFGGYVSIRKMNRDDKNSAVDRGAVGQQSAIENAFTQVPKFYLDGPLLKMFELLNNIYECVKRIEKRGERMERKIDDWTEPEDNHHRRR